MFAKGGRPAILFFFGVGWEAGTPTQFFPHCAYLASRGMVAFAVEYRTESSHGTTPIDCLLDARAAIRWVREHASRMGIDPHRVVHGVDNIAELKVGLLGLLGERRDPVDSRSGSDYGLAEEL